MARYTVPWSLVSDHHLEQRWNQHGRVLLHHRQADCLADGGGWSDGRCYVSKYAHGFGLSTHTRKDLFDVMTTCGVRLGWVQANPFDVYWGLRKDWPRQLMSLGILHSGVCLSHSQRLFWWRADPMTALQFIASGDMIPSVSKREEECL